MKILAPWLPPLIAAGAVLGLVAYLAAWKPREGAGASSGLTMTEGTEAEQLCEGYPWEDPNSSDIRVLNVLVELDGVYIGEQCIPYEHFRAFLIQHAKRWRPHQVVIHGSIDARFGRSVEVFDTLLRLNLRPVFDTKAHAPGTRLPAVEIWKDDVF